MNMLVSWTMSKHDGMRKSAERYRNCSLLPNLSWRMLSGGLSVSAPPFVGCVWMCAFNAASRNVDVNEFIFQFFFRRAFLLSFRTTTSSFPPSMTPSTGTPKPLTPRSKKAYPSLTVLLSQKSSKVDLSKESQVHFFFICVEICQHPDHCHGTYFFLIMIYYRGISHWWPGWPRHGLQFTNIQLKGLWGKRKCPNSHLHERHILKTFLLFISWLFAGCC